MEIKFVFFVIAIIYWIFKAVSNSKENNAPAQPQPARPKRNTNKPKSFDDIYKEFVQEIENKNKPQPQVKPVQTKSVKRENMDWQEVSKSKIVPKKQLIKYEDYHAEHGEIQDITSIDSIVESEGNVFVFDKDNIDWKQAIIAKEILERKYA